MDDGLTVPNLSKNHTDLHFIQALIDKTTMQHIIINKFQAKKKHEQLIHASQRMYQLHNNINKEKPAEIKQQEQEEYTEIQREPSSKTVYQKTI
jgi:hypothetical protein